MSKTKVKDKKKHKHDKKRERALSNLMKISEDTLQSPRDRGFNACPCPKKCTLHGECLLCVSYHARKDQLPRCER